MIIFTVYLLYKKQRNIVVTMNKKAKRSFFQSLGTNCKEFCNNAKPFFSNKTKIQEGISSILVDNKEISEKSDIASSFNNFFVNIVKDLNITPWNNYESTDDIEELIHSFRDHPSVLQIRSNSSNHDNFSFSHVEPKAVYRVIKNLNRRKAVSGSIPTRIIQDFIDIYIVHSTY